MRVSDFHFDLPEELIAQHPPAVRGASRMLVLDRQTGAVSDAAFRDLPQLLRPGDLLILNDSRVLPARLFATRAGLTTQAGSPRPSGVIEVLLTEEVEPLVWRALVKPAKKVRVGERLEFHETSAESPGLKPLSARADHRGLKPDATPESKPHAAEAGFRLRREGGASGHQPGGTPAEGGSPVLSAEVVAAGEFGERTLRFGAVEDFYERVGRIGHMPLPPYIRRDQAEEPDSEEDRERYQTVYSRQVGSAAAPTAGLHFTPEVLEELRARGVEVEYITLHVGLGTFQPVRVAEVKDIRLHEERYTLPESTAEALNRAMAEGRRVIAVGTTTTRVLEHVATEAEQEHVSGAKEGAERSEEQVAAAKAALYSKHDGAGTEVPAYPKPGRFVRLKAHSGATSIFIAPGHRFRVVSGLLTNFHLPESTLLMLVSAFAGDGDEGRTRVLAAYEHAVRAGYRFYSYGDCMLVV